MTSSRLPTLFIGHGSPMNLLELNRHTQAWARLVQSIARPKAILVVSAHWYRPVTAVTAVDSPETIHDFYGFPQALFDYQYPAAGSPTLAARVRELLASKPVEMNLEWGLDHGTWSVLAHLYPHADIPVVQLAIDSTQPAQAHYELGKRLAPLRDEGILILGSGNVVHNLGMMQPDGAAPYDWATRFNNTIRSSLIKRDDQTVIDFAAQGFDAQLAVPTPEHFLPLLYVLGAAGDDAARIETDGLELGSISMLSVSFGVTP